MLNTADPAPPRRKPGAPPRVWIEYTPPHITRAARVAQAAAVDALPKWERLWVEWRRVGSRLPPGMVGWAGSCLDPTTRIGAGVGSLTRPRR